MTIYEFFTLMGGVGLFLYGMSIMSSGLKAAAGDQMKTILEKATANKYKAVFVGILVTILIQSSSATDMMVISFVNSGLMTLTQAIGVIMGANIGTTITAQITAFNLGAYAPIILFVGAAMYLFLKNNTIKHIGSIIMGFGMLFFGISVIKGAIVPLSQSEEFISFLSTLRNPIIAVLFGVAFTALLQSSSSSVVIFQTFAIQGLLDFRMTVYLIVGAAIGSVTPNILASLTTNRNGKRTAVLNLLFNLIRAVVVIALISVFPAFLSFIENITPGDIGHQVANAHTIFAILAVIIELPFSATIVALSKKIIPLLPEENKKREQRKLHYMLDSTENLPASVLLQQARMELTRMYTITRDAYRDAIESFFELDDKKSADAIDAEETVDILVEKIQNRMIALRAHDFFSKREMAQISQMALAATDIERISDHARNIAEYEQLYKEKKAVITDVGMADLKRLAEESLKAVDLSLKVFESKDIKGYHNVEIQEQIVDDIHEEVVNGHITRLMQAASHPVGGIIYSDMTTDLERCSDHALNIAGSVRDEFENK